MAEADRTTRRSTSADALDQPMRVTTPVGWLLVVLLGALVGGGTVWSAVVDIPISIKGKGLLVDRDGMDQISAPARGSLVQVLVEVGDTVSEGDVVAVIDQAELRAQIANRRIALDEAVKRRTEQLEFSRHAADSADQQEQARLKAASEKLRLSEERLALLREREAGIERLAASGIIARDRWLALKVDIAAASETVTGARNEMDLARTDRAMRDAERAREDVKIDHEIAEIRSQLAGLIDQHQLGSQVKATFSGQIVERDASLGDFLNAGQPIFTSGRSDGVDTEQDDLMAMIFVTQADGKRIVPGMVVQVAPGAVDRAEHGFIQGRVSTISHDPLSTAGLTLILRNDQLVRTITQQFGSPFLVMVGLERSPDTPSGLLWSTSRGPNFQLHTGDSADGEFTVQERRLLGLLVPSVARFFASDTARGG